MNILKWYIGTFHVSTPNKTIIRDLYDRSRSRSPMTRQARKEVYRAAMDYHRQNYELYEDVCLGQVGRRRAKKRKSHENNRSAPRVLGGKTKTPAV